MPIPFALASVQPPALTSLSTSGGGDTAWFIHEQTLGFSFTTTQEGIVGSTGATTSSVYVEGNVGVNQYITSSFQFSAASTEWHTLSGTGYDVNLGVINSGQGYVYTVNPGYYRRRKALDDEGSGCTGSFSFTIDPAQLDIMGILSYAKIYASLAGNGGCDTFESWLINY